MNHEVENPRASKQNIFLYISVENCMWKYCQEGLFRLTYIELKYHAEFRQDVPCAKKGPLPTECPSLPGKGKHKHLVLKWPLFFHSSRKKRVEAQVPITLLPSLCSHRKIPGFKPSILLLELIYPVFSCKIHNS